MQSPRSCLPTAPVSLDAGPRFPDTAPDISAHYIGTSAETYSAFVLLSTHIYGEEYYEYGHHGHIHLFITLFTFIAFKNPFIVFCFIFHP